MDLAAQHDNLLTILQILQIIAVPAGLALFFGAFFQFKRYGETRTFMSYHMSLAGPLGALIAGATFMVLPTIIGVGIEAVYGTQEVMAYTVDQSGLGAFIPNVVLFVRIIGIGAFMRGIMLFSRAGHSQGQQPGVLSKAILHIFGGVLCINLWATVSLVRQLMGMAPL